MSGNNPSQVSFTIPSASTPAAFRTSNYGHSFAHGGSTQPGAQRHHTHAHVRASGSVLQPVNFSMTSEDLKSQLNFAHAESNISQHHSSSSSALVGDSIHTFHSTRIPVAVTSSGATKHRWLTLSLAHCLPPESPHNTLDRILQLQITDELEHFFFFHLKMRAIDFSDMHRTQKMESGIDFTSWGEKWIPRMCQQLRDSQASIGMVDTAVAGNAKDGKDAANTSGAQLIVAADPATVQRWSSTLVQDQHTGQWLFSITASSMMKSHDMMHVVVKPGSDADIKTYLSDKLTACKKESERSQAELSDSTGSSQRLAATVSQLQSELTAQRAAMDKRDSDTAREQERAIHELSSTHRATLDARIKEHADSVQRLAAEHKSALTALQQRFDAVDRQNRELTSANITLEADVRNLTQKLNRTEADFKHTNGEFEVARTRIKELETRCAQFDNSGKQDSAELASLKAQVAGAERFAKGMQATVDGMTKRAENAEIGLKAQKKLAEEKTHAVDDLQKQLVQAHQVLADIKSTHDKVKSERDEIVRATSKQRKQLDHAQAKYYEKKSVIHKLEVDLKMYTERIKTLETELTNARTQLKKDAEELKQKDHMMAMANRDVLESAKSRLGFSSTFGASDSLSGITGVPTGIDSYRTVSFVPDVDPVARKDFDIKSDSGFTPTSFGTDQTTAFASAANVSAPYNLTSTSIAVASRSPYSGQSATYSSLTTSKMMSSSSSTSSAPTSAYFPSASGPVPTSHDFNSLHMSGADLTYDH